MGRNVAPNPAPWAEHNDRESWTLGQAIGLGVACLGTVATVFETTESTGKWVAAAGLATAAISSVIKRARELRS
jgi:hypothetical protein